MTQPYGSAPPLGAAQPIVDGIGHAVDAAKGFMSHPMDSIKGMLGMPAGSPSGAPTHEQEIQKINDDMNAHRNDAANQSFLPHRVVPKMK